MTTPKQVARQLCDLATWAPLLADAIVTLVSPRASGAPVNAHGTYRDLGDLVAPAVDAENDGAHAIRSHAQIIAWATAWATTANLVYAGNPLYALADNVQCLASEWGDWDAFTDDLAILHRRVARLTGHAPRTIGPCPENGCPEHITQAQTRHGAEGLLECSRGHTYTDETAYIEAMREADRTILQTITDPTIRVTISQFLNTWPELTKDDIKNWTRTGRLTLSDTTPKTLNLATANLLATHLTSKRKHDNQGEL